MVALANIVAQLVVSTCITSSSTVPIPSIEAHSIAPRGPVGPKAQQAGFPFQPTPIPMTLCSLTLTPRQPVTALALNVETTRKFLTEFAGILDQSILTHHFFDRRRSGYLVKQDSGEIIRVEPADGGTTFWVAARAVNVLTVLLATYPIEVDFEVIDMAGTVVARGNLINLYAPMSRDTHNVTDDEPETVSGTTDRLISSDRGTVSHPENPGHTFDIEVDPVPPSSPALSENTGPQTEDRTRIAELKPLSSEVSKQLPLSFALEDLQPGVSFEDILASVLDSDISHLPLSSSPYSFSVTDNGTAVAQGELWRTEPHSNETNFMSPIPVPDVPYSVSFNYDKPATELDESATGFLMDVARSFSQKPGEIESPYSNVNQTLGLRFDLEPVAEGLAYSGAGVVLRTMITFVGSPLVAFNFKIWRSGEVVARGSLDRVGVSKSGHVEDTDVTTF